MDGVRRGGEGGDVVIIPKREEGIGAVVGGGVDGAVFGADHAPAAFGLDPAQGGAGLRALPAKAGGVRGLVKAVGCRYRADLDRFKEDGVARVHLGGHSKNLLGAFTG